MKQVSISLFDNIKHTKNGSVIPIDLFFENVKEGKWQDMVLPIRAIPDKDKRRDAKKKVPYVTISGLFSERTDGSIISHSGYIGIDVDDVDPEQVKAMIKNDPYVYADFTSISGQGICIVFKINGEKHREVFEGISEYLFERYLLVVDPSGVNPSRARYVSFDPHLHTNEEAEKFTYIPKKEKIQTKIPEVVFVQNDFDSIIQEIVSRRLDITGGYHRWLSLCYALCDRFGEAGRTYFHSLSQFSATYNYKAVDKQFSACLKRSASPKSATIATFYYHAKQAGLQIVSAKTKLISQTAYLAKKGKRNKEETVKLLKESEGIKPEESAPIVDQVFDNNIFIDTSENPIEALELWMKQNYDLRRNIITRYIENGGKPMQAADLNSIFIAAKKVFEKLTFDLIEKLINSNFTPQYNPLLEFLERHQSRRPKGTIRALFETIESDTGMSGGEFFPDYKLHFGTKWLVSIISSINGVHSPLMLVLSGNEQGTGKTEFWRRLLPKELQSYYAESKLDAGKDDEILMTQKLLIMDDEMGGKSKKDEKRLKELLSKQTFSLREPYGKNNVDLQRLAVMAGTTNDNEILNDPTGNRRIIPINVLSIDHEAYNKIDKVDLLMEAYQLWKDGFNWELTREDVRVLNQNTGYFEQTSPEYDLIVRNFELITPENKLWAVFMTPTEIKSSLEIRSGQKLNSNRLGVELKRIGFEKVPKKILGKSVRGYELVKSEKPQG